MPAAKKAGAVYVATTSGSTDIKGETYVFVRGQTRVREGHALLKAVPDYFEPVEEHVHYEHGASAKADTETRA